MEIGLVLLPLLGAVVAALVRSPERRPLVVPVAGFLHLALLAGLALGNVRSGRGFWLRLDPLATVILGTVSVLFLIAAAYAPGYLALRRDRDNRVFCASLLVFLAMTSLVALAQHLGLLWVAMEATTLATAPLLYFNRTARSLEATWKYLMIGSVGIAIALLGSLFLAYSAHVGGAEPSLLFDDLLAGAGAFSRPWLRASFVLLLVGYGTKMGLEPLHT